MCMEERRRLEFYQRYYLDKIDYDFELHQDKLDKIKSKLDTNISYYLLSRSDQIAWLLNLRGNDTKHTPIFMAYALISFDKNKNSVF